MDTKGDDFMKAFSMESAPTFPKSLLDTRENRPASSSAAGDNVFTFAELVDYGFVKVYCCGQEHKSAVYHQNTCLRLMVNHGYDWVNVQHYPLRDPANTVSYLDVAAIQDCFDKMKTTATVMIQAISTSN